jgi:hypothetical protein
MSNGPTSSAIEVLKGMTDRISKISPGTPCDCGREHVCEGCEIIFKLIALGAQ